MEVKVVKGGDLARRAMMYAPPTQKVREYYKNNLIEAQTKLGTTSDSFLRQTSMVYDQFNSDDVILASKAIMLNATGHVSDYVIHSTTYDTVQDANLATQKYIMAQPELNKLYNKKMCHGFEETYFDNEPNVKPEWRNDYLAVTDGEFSFEEEGYYTINSWDTDVSPELDVIDKFSIQETWDNVVNLINNGIDPSDPDRGVL